MPMHAINKIFMDTHKSFRQKKNVEITYHPKSMGYITNKIKYLVFSVHGSFELENADVCPPYPIF